MSGAILAWLWAFLFTQAVEVPIYVALMRRAPGPRATPPQHIEEQIALGFWASAITHPIVWFVIPQIPSASYWTMVVRAEGFAVVVEGLYLYSIRAFGLRRAMLFSLIANMASVGLGFTSRALFDWP